MTPAEQWAVLVVGLRLTWQWGVTSAAIVGLGWLTWLRWWLRPRWQRRQRLRMARSQLARLQVKDRMRPVPTKDTKR